VNMIMEAHTDKAMGWALNAHQEDAGLYYRDKLKQPLTSYQNHWYARSCPL
jgi:hypothetical protein